MATADSSHEISEAAGGGVFTRKATGLVREISPFSTFVFNLASAPTAIFLAVSIYWTLAAFPGGNTYLALGLCLIVAVTLATCFGLISSAIPRVGGDYVLVGRVLHPLIGIVSSFMWVAGVFASIAYVGLAFVTVGLGPGFSAIGLLSNSSTLTDWGATLASSKWWQFGLGSAIIIVACLLLSTGWKITMRLINTWWALSMLGIFVAAIVLLAKGHSGFISAFNDVTNPVTGSSDSYNKVISDATQAGVDVDPSFSLSNTWPTWGATMSLGIWTWLSIYIAGEVRRARTMTQPMVMSAGSVFHVGTGFIMTAIFFAVFGTQFFTAINGIVGTDAYPFASPPYWSFLTSIAGGSSALAWFLLITFVFAFPIWIINNFAVTVRSMFAWAFDSLLPIRVAQVNPRFNTPVIATVVAVAINIGALYWAISSTSFFGVLAEAVLFNMFAMFLLAVSAAVLPYRRPEAWRASATTARVAGIPVVTVVGAVASVFCVVIFFLYLHYPGLGIADRGKFGRDSAIVIGAALLLYFGARIIRSRQGIDLAKMTEEIPPE
jgi:APA family basic amino acid/polyamine antiporter